MQRRVVITGLGVVAPNGIGKEQFWNANIAGQSGIRRITRFDASQLPSRIAGEVPDFKPERYGISSEEASSIDRNTQFAVAASTLALEDAKLLHTMDEEQRERVGVYMGSAMASTEEGERVWLKLTGNGTHSPRDTMNGHFPPTLLMTHASAAMIAAHHKFYGPCGVIATGCSAGADAIGEAFWAIQEGRVDMMLAGGSDSCISRGGIAAFAVIGAVSTRNDEPEKASRPYDKDRDGFVMAEGAGVVVLEEREHALARNAHIYAELIIFVSNSNSYHMTALPENGEPLKQLLTQALQEAQIAPEILGYINSHGSSTPVNEGVETAAYKAAFGETAYRIPISSTKSMIGHTQGAASAIEAIVTALVIDQQILPPTINLENPDPKCDLDYVPNVARRAKVDVALTHSSGFGGVNTALILAKPDWMNSRAF